RTLGMFFAMLAVFHLMEYITTALYRKDTRLSAFLLNHSPEYHAAMAAGVIEYCIEYYFWPTSKAFGYINAIAVVLAAASQILRSTAMITAGHNFTHIIAEYKDPAHSLVTHGVYRY
ncbi:hypothetical protein BDK51DRAFT_11692, partial [Blyttiomyces helicus]